MMATETDDPKPTKPLDLETAMEVDSVTDSSGSESDSDGPSETHVEWLATGRSKRSTAGNRMKSMLANEEPADADSDLELLFQEDDDDAGFTDKGEDDASDAQMESSDDEDENAAQADDLEGEKELEREAREKRAAARKRKAQEAIPAKFRKKVRISHPPDTPTTTAPPPPKPRPKKKSERTSWLPTATDMPTRASERKTTKLSKEQLHHQMVEREARRKKQLESMEKKAKKMEFLKKPPMTQAERLKEAEIVEKRNSKSLNRWEEAEKQREEERRAKLAALNNRRLEGPVVTFWSGIVDLSEVQLKHVGKMVSMEEKPKRKRPSTIATAAANTATTSPKPETPSNATNATANAENVTDTNPMTESSKESETSKVETTSTGAVAVTKPTLIPPAAVSSAPLPEASTVTTTSSEPIVKAPACPTETPAPISVAEASTAASGPPTDALVVLAAAPKATDSTDNKPQPTPERPSLPSENPAHSPQTAKTELPVPAPAGIMSSSATPSTNASPKPTIQTSPVSAGPSRPQPVKIEPPSSKPLPIALRPDIGPRFMPPPNPHFAQPPPPLPSVLAPPAGMMNGSMPVLGYASTHVPRSAAPTAPVDPPVPTSLSCSPAHNLPNIHTPSTSKPPIASPSPFQPPPQQQPPFHTTATFQPIVPPVPPINPVKNSKKESKQQTGSQKASNQTLATQKSIVTTEPPESELPLEGKVTRSCIILQDFDDEAVKRPEVQTQILFGRKMTKLAKPPHPPLCAITNHPARYRDPKTGLPFYNTYAFKEIQKLAKGEFKWSELLGTWVGDGSEAAKGVPDRFIRPETEEERKERLEKKEREKKLAEEQEKKAEEAAKDGDKGTDTGVLPTPPPPVPASSAPANTAAPVAIPSAQAAPATATLPTTATSSASPPVPVGVPSIMPSPDDPIPAGPSLARPHPVPGGHNS